MSAPLRILVVRRDNIGDLVCTTPLFSALRQCYPDAWIAAWVNSYNVAVLARNPDIDEVYAYRKLKHREAGDTLISNLWQRLRMIAAVRRKRLDLLVLAGNAARAGGLAKLLGAKSVIGLAPAEIAAAAPDNLHEVEITYRLGLSLGLSEAIPAPVVTPDPVRVAQLRAEVSARLPGVQQLVGVHISARKPSQRWPVDRYAALIRSLTRDGSCGVLLFWSPGAENDARHPGDDEKAQSLLLDLRGVPVMGVPTHSLEELIAGLSLCDRVVCSDGGAMHIAAALGRPIVCLFGRSSAARWHPWGVAHVLLQPESLDVRDVSIDEVLQGLAKLA